MTYRAIAASEYDPESPVTTSLAQAWSTNPEGIAAGDAGAIIQGSAIDWASVSGDVGQGQLKTTTGTVSFFTDDVNTATAAVRTLPGGQYGFLYEYQASDAQTGGGANTHHSSVLPGRVGVEPSTPPTENYGLHQARTSDYGYRQEVTIIQAGDATASDLTTTVRQRYVQASPPYGTEDGEWGLVIEADVRSDGIISGVYVAADPVWANNGPTRIRPDWIDRETGRKYKRVYRAALMQADLEAGRCNMDEYIAAQKEAVAEDVEIDYALKNADMDLVPHSFHAPLGTVCLLDPMSTHDLLTLHEQGEDIARLIHRGYIRIGDTCKRNAPKGVTPVRFSWRLT